jgi:hypothetical protein
MANELVISDNDLQVVKQCQSLMQTAYDDRVLVNQIVNQIALPEADNVTVNISDVLQIARLASSMHLDVMLGGIWGYKDKNNKLVCGVTKKGWQQALHSQPDYAGISFENIGELSVLDKKLTTKKGTEIVHVSYYPAVKCIISKQRPDGTIAKFEGTAYFDEEFDITKPTWKTRAKRMLEGRALTIAASNAYGWGAYDVEEAEAVLEGAAVKAQKQEVSSVAKDELIADMKRAVSRQELVRIFKNAPDDLQKDPDIIQLGKELTNNFINKE